MRRIHGLLGIGLMSLIMQSGCQSDNTAPAPGRIPGPGERRMTNDDPVARPLPGAVRDDLPPPPFNDVPLVSQQAPETARFVEAYEHVGRPRILVWVSNSAGNSYDQAAAQGIDYAAMQNILNDWLSADGKVAVISPQAARQILTPQEAQGLDAARPAATQDISDKLKADVLVLVQAQPTRQSYTGPQVRLVADVSNLRGAESIGRAVVDVPPPLDKPQINKYTRFVARKLMADMTNAWTSMGAPAPAAEAPPAGAAPDAVPSGPPAGAAPQAAPDTQPQTIVPATQPPPANAGTTNPYLGK